VDEVRDSVDVSVSNVSPKFAHLTITELPILHRAGLGTTESFSFPKIAYCHGSTILVDAANIGRGASVIGMSQELRNIVHERRGAKQALFETVLALHASGKTVSGIVRETGMSRNQIVKSHSNARN
jgi:hypothetical protein